MGILEIGVFHFAYELTIMAETKFRNEQKQSYLPSN